MNGSMKSKLPVIKLTSHKGVEYIIRTINNVIITLYGDKWLTTLIVGSTHTIYTHNIYNSADC